MVIESLRLLKYFLFRLLRKVQMQGARGIRERRRTAEVRRSERPGAQRSRWAFIGSLRQFPLTRAASFLFASKAAISASSPTSPLASASRSASATRR